MDPNKPTSTGHLPTQHADIPCEITHYKKGETLKIKPEDDRLYSVKKGCVQRLVELAGRNGLISLNLGKIEARGYFHPRSATGAALKFNMRLQFLCLEDTTILKLTDDGFPKKREDLLDVIGILTHVQSNQIAAAEAIIQQQFERAEREAAAARSANDELVALKEELAELKVVHSSVQDSLRTAGSENMRLACELGTIRGQLVTARKNEDVLRSQVRSFRGQLKKAWTELRIAECEKDLQQQFKAQAEWINNNCPDLPVVKEAQELLSSDLSDDLDALFEETFSKSVKPPPLPASHSARTQVRTSSTDEVFEVEEGELIDKPAQSSEGAITGPEDDFEDDEEASTSSRQTIPWDLNQPPSQPASKPGAYSITSDDDVWDLKSPD